MVCAIKSLKSRKNSMFDDKLRVFTPVKNWVFGFWVVFGFYNVRFLGRVRVLNCSVCSVDFVDKMWENLWVRLWENCGKVCGKVRGWVDFHRIWRVLHNFGHGLCNSLHVVLHTGYQIKKEVLHNFHSAYYYYY